MKKFAALMLVLSACLFSATGCGDDAADGGDADKKAGESETK